MRYHDPSDDQIERYSIKYVDENIRWQTLNIIYAKNLASISRIIENMTNYNAENRWNSIQANDAYTKFLIDLNMEVKKS